MSENKFEKGDFGCHRLTDIDGDRILVEPLEPGMVAIAVNDVEVHVPTDELRRVLNEIDPPKPTPIAVKADPDLGNLTHDLGAGGAIVDTFTEASAVATLVEPDLKAPEPGRTFVKEYRPKPVHITQVTPDFVRSLVEGRGIRGIEPRFAHKTGAPSGVVLLDMGVDSLNADEFVPLYHYIVDEHWLPLRAVRDIDNYEEVA